MCNLKENKHASNLSFLQGLLYLFVIHRKNSQTGVYHKLLFTMKSLDCSSVKFFHIWTTKIKACLTIIQMHWWSLFKMDIPKKLNMWKVVEPIFRWLEINRQWKLKMNFNSQMYWYCTNVNNIKKIWIWHMNKIQYAITKISTISVNPVHCYIMDVMFDDRQRSRRQ